MKTRRNAREARVAAVRSEGRDEAGLPVVAVHDVRRRIESGGERQHGAREEGEARGVVAVVAVGAAVEAVAVEVLVGDDERDGDVAMPQRADAGLAERRRRAGP